MKIVALNMQVERGGPSRSFSLTPRFSEVLCAPGNTNRFSGFSPADKLLKRFNAVTSPNTSLKRGVNETLARTHL